MYYNFFCISNYELITYYFWDGRLQNNIYRYINLVDKIYCDINIIEYILKKTNLPDDTIGIIMEFID